MSTTSPSVTRHGLGVTSRRDTWWLKPLLVFLGFSGFIVYSTWAAFQNAHYWVAGTGYLSPFYSPELFGQSPHSVFGPGLDGESAEAGWRPIREIEAGDRVLAADGRFRAATVVSSHPYTSPALIRIVARGSNVPTLASDNHPFLIYRPTRAHGNIVDGEVSWMQADEIRKGDYTMTPVLATDEADDPMPEKDEDYWFLFGLYLAQGSLQRADRIAQ